MTTLSAGAFRRLAEDACRRCGAGEAAARSLVTATLAAEYARRAEVGVAHLVDYLRALRGGRIDGMAEPQITSPLPAFVDCDARGGIAQLGFDLAFEDLCRRATLFGIAIFTQRNSFPAGELGYYVRGLASHGLVSIAVSNANAVMATAIGGDPAFATNPLAFGAPLPGPGNHLVIDQASSATAFVNIRQAARDGREIPAGWALDAAKLPTTDPAQALLGALLPFGGRKGANIALMVEVLSAGVSGASWSLDAGDFQNGDRCPAIGLTVVALRPVAEDFETRLAAQLDRLRFLGVHIPGTASPRGSFEDDDAIEVDAALLRQIEDLRLGRDAATTP